MMADAPVSTELPAPARPWIGLALGVAAAGGLRLARPEALERLTGTPMLICHALTIAALTTLLQETFQWVARGRALRDAEADGLANASAWPRLLVAGALRGRLSGLFGQSDIETRLDTAAHDARTNAAWRWWSFQILAFALPALGFFDGWRNVRADTDGAALVEVFLPLPVAIGEAGLVLAWTTWLAFEVQTQFERWRSLAGRRISRHSPILRDILGRGDSAGMKPRDDSGDDQLDETLDSGDDGFSGLDPDLPDDEDTKDGRSDPWVPPDRQKIASKGSMFDELFDPPSADVSAPGENVGD